MLKSLLPLTLTLLVLTGCDRIADEIGLPNPAKEAAAREADGKAIGAACRHSGQALEDCYLMNPTAHKASIYAGWREMNDYMMQNNIPVVPARLPQPGLTTKQNKSVEGDGHAAPASNPAKGTPSNGDSFRNRLQ